MFKVNFAMGYVLPPYWANHPAVVKKFENNASQSEVIDLPHAMPLSMKWERELDSEWFTLPIEPIVTISGRNIIVRRNVAKHNDTLRRGCVVETWATDDYDITIAGVFISDKENELPEDLIKKLRYYCEAREPVMVESKIFTLFKITKIIIEDFSWPHTKGMQNQMFALKCYSYETPELVIKDEITGDIAI